MLVEVPTASRIIADLSPITALPKTLVSVPTRYMSHVHAKRKNG